MLDGTIYNQLNNHNFSQIAEQTSKRVILKLYRYTSSNKDYTNVNIPPAFIQELSVEDEVTAEIIITSDGRKGILLLKQEGLRN